MITRSLCALLALAVGLSPVIAARLDSAVAGAAGAAPSRWTRLKTPNFTLLGEQGDKPLRRVADRMEQFREVFGRVFPSTKQAMPAPIVVHVFGLERAYQPFMPLFNGKRVDVGGYFLEAAPAPELHHAERSMAGERAYRVDLPRVRPPARRQLAGRRAGVVQRGAGASTTAPTQPKRRTRGIARQRSSTSHILQLRERFIPLARAAGRATTDSPLYNEGERRCIFYAESWALVHYLLVGSPQRTGQLATYLAAVRRRRGAGRRGVPRGLRRRAKPSSRRSFGAT